jgi:hypothetical protein
MSRVPFEEVIVWNNVVVVCKIDNDVSEEPTIYIYSIAISQKKEVVRVTWEGDMGPGLQKKN